MTHHNIAYQANVGISKALAYDPDNKKHDKNNPETWDMFDADNFDKEKHNGLEFYCPDCFEENGRLSRLKRPSNGFSQMIPCAQIDPQTGIAKHDHQGNLLVEYKRFYFPARFTLYPGERHHCDLAQKQSYLSRITDNYGGVNDTNSGSRIININIPAGQTIHIKPPFADLKNRATQSFNQTSSGNNRTKNRPAVKSSGINNIRALAEILDATKRDKDQRKKTLLRIGGGAHSLDELYFSDSIKMYRSLFSKAQKEGWKNQISLFLFKPNCNRKFWIIGTDGTTTVPSQNKTIADKNGREFNITTHLNFKTKDSYCAFLKAFNETQGNEQRSFLVYSEHTCVNLKQYLAELKNVDCRLKKKASVNIDVQIFDAGQFMHWSPHGKQMLLFENDDLNPDVLSL